MRVLDLFLFSNEFAVVRARLAEWARTPAVTHVVVEADETFTGFKKPPLWALRAQDEHVAAENVVAGVVELPAHPDPWVREAAQRDALYTLAASLNPDPDDLVLIGDADEIVRADRLDAIAEATLGGPVCLNMAVFVWDLHHHLPGPWPHPKAARWKHLDGHLNQLRTDFGLPMVADAGWHLTYFGGARKSALKLKSFSHTEKAYLADVPTLERYRAEGRHIDGSPLEEGVWPFPAHISEALTAS